jgi:hypothetical protein
MAVLAFLRAVAEVDSDGNATGDFECSACGEKFRPDGKRFGAIDTSFVAHRLECHPIGEDFGQAVARTPDRRNQS